MPHGGGCRRERSVSVNSCDSSDSKIENRSFGETAIPSVANAHMFRVRHTCEASVFGDSYGHPHHHCIVRTCDGHAIEPRTRRWRRNRASLRFLGRLARADRSGSVAVD